MSASTDASTDALKELLGTPVQLQAAIDELRTNSSQQTSVFLVDFIVSTIYSAALDEERVASFCNHPHRPSQKKKELVAAIVRNLCESGSLKGLEVSETRPFLPWASIGIFCGGRVFPPQSAQSWQPLLDAALKDGSVQSAIDCTAKSDEDKAFAKFVLRAIQTIVKNHAALTSDKSYRDSLTSEMKGIAASHGATVPDGAQELAEQFHTAVAYFCTTILRGTAKPPINLVGLRKDYKLSYILHNAVAFMVQDQQSHLHGASQLHPILANLLLLALAKLAGKDSSSFSQHTIPDDDDLRQASAASEASEASAASAASAEPQKKRARVSSS
jgi:hypothetical protein